MSIFTPGEARLKILRLLRGANEQPLNHELLASGLQSTGMRISADQVRTELAWLAEQSCVKLIAVAHLSVAELLPRGMDVAKGLTEIPGIDRHIPGSGL